MNTTVPLAPISGPQILPASTVAVAEAARCLAAGQPVALPTETVYGLAADAATPPQPPELGTQRGAPGFG